MWKGIWRGNAFALKQLGNTEIESVAKEGDTMMKLNHPNIVKFWGIYKGFFQRSLILIKS